jgi:hypothetical protein
VPIGERVVVEFPYAPTLQNPPPVEKYMYIDHTYISSRAPCDEAAARRRSIGAE